VTEPATVVDAGRPRAGGGLLRVLGTAFGLAIGVGATIGGGILRTPGDVAGYLPSAVLFMAVWVFGALNSLMGATVYAELGTMLPRSGGIYVYAHRAFGDGMGFFVGYADWVNWSVAPAALSLLVGEYAGHLFPALAGHVALVALLILTALAALQWLGVRWGGWIQEATSLLKTLALLGLVAAAFLLPHSGTAGAVATPLAVPHGLPLLFALALAMQGVIFTYDSYYAVVYYGEEVRDPGREVPRSIFRGLLVIIGVYLLMNVAFLAVLPMSRIAHEPFVGGAVAQALFGERGDVIIRSIVIVSVIGTVNSEVLSAPRILLAMSRDGLFPKGATAINEGGTPTVALALTFAVSALFLLSGSFNAVLGIDTIFIVVLYAVSFTALFVLRRREPTAPRPYRAWGYPWVPGLALLIALAFLAVTAVDDVHDTLIALACLLASWPASRLVRRWMPAREAQ
jgi:basic amino acid/polyamine antiporter, APA family